MWCTQMNFTLYPNDKEIVHNLPHRCMEPALLRNRQVQVLEILRPAELRQQWNRLLQLRRQCKKQRGRQSQSSFHQCREKKQERNLLR